MPRSSGTFSLPAGNPVVTGTVISTTWANNTLNDIANEITNSLPRDGTAPPLANIPFGNYKITGLGAATLPTDAAQYGQIQSGTANYLTAVSGTNTITANLSSPTLTAYAAGNTFRFTSTGTNTGATTVNINGLGAKTINKDGSALVAGDITSGRTYELIYDGINFSLISGGSIPDASITNAKLAFDGGALGYRNAIINGGMQVDQRNSGVAQTITAAAALAYTVDRWYAYCTGANVTGQQVAGTAQTKSRYRFTGAASVTKIGFAQRIEAANSYHLNNGKATLSVDLANSLLTTVTWTAWYANTADTFGTLGAPTRTQIATGTFTINSTVTRYSTNITIPSAATTGIEIEFSVAAQTSGTWTIGNVQLEAGSIATPFENRSYGAELDLCQRYYEVITQRLFSGNVTSGQNYYSNNLFAVTKRATPTAVGTNVAAINFPATVGATSTGLDYLYEFRAANATGTGLFNSNFTVSAEL